MLGVLDFWMVPQSAAAAGAPGHSGSR